MNSLEELIIYKQFLELIFYTENIIIKYPKVEKYSLCSEIKTCTYNGMRLIINAQKSRNIKNRLDYLDKLDSGLKMLKVFIRVSKKKKYINVKNYNAWSKKLTNICNLLGGWINACLKQ